MLVVQRDEYEKILSGMNLSLTSKEKCIDAYHKNDWDRFTMHCSGDKKNECPSYIDFFFDAKSMVQFIYGFIKEKVFEKSYIAPLYNDRYKLKKDDDDVCMDIYDEFKKLLHSLGLRVNTNSAIQMSKDELLNWCGRLSIGGFCGVSEYAIIIPEQNLLVIPHHHMNYLIYTNNKDELLKWITVEISDEILVDA